MIDATRLPGCPVIVTGANSVFTARRAAQRLLAPGEHLGVAVRLTNPTGAKTFAYPVLDPDLGQLDDREVHALLVLDAATRH